jgi:hypothetical protein
MLSTISSIPVACTIPGTEVIRNASRRNAAFFELRSTRWTLAPDLSAIAQDDAGKATAAAEVDPGFGDRGKRDKLERVGDVPGPEMLQRRGRDQIGLGLPLPKEVKIEIEPCLCFT